MHALVTGGGGFLGLYITEQLCRRGDRVRVFCRGRYPQLEALDVECVQGDLQDPEAVRRACEGIDTVFHVAAVPGVWGAWKKFHGINTLGTRNVLEACERQGVERIVYTSSPSVVFDGKDHLGADESLPYAGNFLCHYPHSKALAEREVLTTSRGRGLLSTALRPHLIWGPRDNHLIPRLIARARSGRLRRVGDGNNLISMAYVENVAHAHLLAADALTSGSPLDGQAYFINEPEPVPLWEWIDELLQRAGLPPVKKSISENAARRIGAACETIYGLLRIQSEPPMTRFVATQLARSHTYRIDRARQDFDYAPLVDVDEGMRRLEPELRALAGTR